MLFALHPSGVMMPVVLPTGGVASGAGVAMAGGEKVPQQQGGHQGKDQEKKKGAKVCCSMDRCQCLFVISCDMHS